MFKILRRRESKDYASPVWQTFAMKHECIVAKIAVSRGYCFSVDLGCFVPLVGSGQLLLEIVNI
jgi:hypothetical protein